MDSSSVGSGGIDVSGTEPLALARDFPKINGEQWLEAVDAVIKGAPFEKRLVSRTASGIAIEPLYDSEAHPVDAASRGVPGSAPWVRGATTRSHQDIDWDIRQRHDLDDPSVANRQILEDLEQGATSILLRIRRKLQPGELATALNGVLLDLAPIALDAGPWALQVAPMLEEVWDAAAIAPQDRRGALRIDPLGSMARFGARMPEALGSIGMHLDAPHLTTMAADATVWSDGGASDALELGLSLATGVEYLRWMTAAGMSVDQAAEQIEFSYSASADQFSTIAKLRAARLAWGRVVQASGGTAGAQRQHAITSPAMFSERAPWVNLLRATTAGFAAAVGGAEAITILPFDSAIGMSAELGRRTARNASLLLMEESHVGVVTDPGGGSWFIEDLTDALAERAWADFQHIEAVGGMHAALAAGIVQDRVARDWKDLSARIATRRNALVGISEFPDLAEEPLVRDELPLLGRYDLDPELEPIPLRTHAGDYEELRRDADAAIERRNLGHEAEGATGGSDIFMATLGPPAVHSARLGFASNFLAAGGIRGVPHGDHLDGFDDPGDVAEAFERSGLTAAVICSSDRMYAEMASDTAAALKSAGCYRVYLAGNPGDARPGYERAGIDDFIHIGTDVVATLQDLQEFLKMRGAVR